MVTILKNHPIKLHQEDCYFTQYIVKAPNKIRCLILCMYTCLQIVPALLISCYLTQQHIIYPALDIELRELELGIITRYVYGFPIKKTNDLEEGLKIVA